MTGETQEKQNIEQVSAPLQTVDLQQSQDFIENTFKDKVDDQILYDKITGVFNTIKTQFPDKDIKTFLNNANLPGLIRKVKMKETEEAIQYFVGEMDDKNKNANSISVYEASNAESEKIDTKKEVSEALQKTRESYGKLDSKYKNPNVDQLSTFEKKIPAETKTTLEANGISYNDYVQYAYTATTFQDKPEVKEFSEKFDDLNKILHLPDISPDPVLKSCTRIENVEELLKDNQSFNDYISDDENFSQVKKADFGLLSGLTSKFIDKDAQNELRKYQQELAKFPDFFDKDGNLKKDVDATTLPKEAQKISADYTNYQQKVTQEITEHLADRTNLITKQRVNYAPISGLARYFDSGTVNENNFAGDFAFDKANGMTMDGDTLNMKGAISGIDVNFSYDLQKNNSPLKSESVLGYDPVEQTFVPGMETDLGVELPSIAQLSTQANTVTDQSNIAKLLENSSSMADFEHNLKAQLGEQLMRPFGKEYIVKHRVQKNLEQNMATQELQDQFIPEKVMQNILQDGKIDKAENASWQAMNIWNASLHHMSLGDIEKMRELTDKTKVLVDKGSFGFLNSPATEKMLQGLKDDENGEGALTFFSWISDPDSKVVNLRDRETLITMGEKNDDLAINMNKLSGNFEKKLSEAEAQELLENIPGQTQVA